MRGDDRPDHAGRTARGADAFEIQRHQHGFRIDPGKLTLSVFASRRRLAPFCSAREMRARSRAIKLSRRCNSALVPVARSAMHESAAAAIPAIAATFSVPGRRSFSCAPPNMDRLDRQSGAQEKKAGAFRSVKFVRGETGRRSTRPDNRSVASSLPERLHHVAVQQDTPRSRQISEISRIGWITPVSLFAVMIETSACLANGRARVHQDRSIPSRETFSQVTSKPSCFSRCSNALQHRMMFRLGS